ncbi:MAG: ATP-binding protein, partial [Ureaplasma sp.]|nr:ATP-binding protein [Ureaplasma sp.]
LIRYYDHKIISFSTTNDNNVKFLKDKKQIYTFQKPLINLLCQQLQSKKYYSFYLHGNFNIGKTYIMILFANELALANLSISFVDMSKISRTFKKANTWNEREQYYEEYFQKMLNSDILIIDELGIEKFSNYIHIDMLLPIFQHRLINKLPVYFISNFNLEKLKLNYKRTNKDSIQLDKFINTIENLVETNVIELIGTDLRKKSI